MDQRCSVHWNIDLSFLWFFSLVLFFVYIKGLTLSLLRRTLTQPTELPTWPPEDSFVCFLTFSSVETIQISSQEVKYLYTDAGRSFI